MKLMHKRTKIVYQISLLLFLSFFITACSDNPSSIGAGLVSDKDLIVSSINSRDNAILQKSHTYRVTSSLSSASRIYLGKLGNDESWAILKFYLPLASRKTDILNDSIEVVSGEIRLIPGYYIGNASAPFDFTGHQINSQWDIATITSDSINSLRYGQTNIINSKTITDSIVTISIQKEVILQWLKSGTGETSVANWGMVLKPTAETAKITGFLALTSTSSNHPKIKIIVKKGTVYQDTVEYNVTADVHLVTSTTQQNIPNELIVQSGVTQRGRLWFDLSQLPDNILINNAVLELRKNPDTTTSVIGSVFSNGIEVYAVDDSSSGTLSSNYSATMGFSDSVYRGDITSIVTYFYQTERNLDLCLTTITPLEGFDKITLYGSTSADILQRPYLKITYTKRVN